MENQHTTPDFENQDTEPNYPDELVLLANSPDIMSVNEWVQYLSRLRHVYTEQELAIIKETIRAKFRADITERIVFKQNEEKLGRAELDISISTGTTRSIPTPPYASQAQLRQMQFSDAVEYQMRQLEYEENRKRLMEEQTSGLSNGLANAIRKYGL